MCAIGMGESKKILHAGHLKSWGYMEARRSIKDELYMQESVMLILLDREKKILARDITLDFLIDTINLWEK